MVKGNEKSPERSETILFAVNTMKIGGAEKIISDLTLGLGQYGYQPVLLSLKDLEYWGQFLQERNIKCYTLGMRSRFDLPVLRKMFSLIREIRPAIIYSLDHRDALFWTRLMARILGRPHILSQHSLTIAGAEAPDSFFYEFIVKVTTPLSDRIVVCGNMVREFLVSSGIPDHKIEVIHNGVPIDRGESSSTFLASWRKRLGVTGARKVVGIVAALRPTKNHHLFLQAAKQVVGQYPNSLFAIVGEGPLREELEELGHRLEISDHLYFLGNVTPASQIMPIFDVGVLSSKKEAFPMVILEYMEAGTPVVSTDSGGPSEIVIDGETGFVVPREDAATLADRILFLLNHPEKSEMMGKKGRNRVCQSFSLDLMVRKNVDLFQKISKPCG